VPLSPSPSPRRARRQLSIASATLLLFALIAAVVVVVEVWRTVEQYHEAMAEGRRDVENIVKSVAQQAELTFRSTDAVLLSLQDQVMNQDYISAEGIERIQKWMTNELMRLPHLSALSVADAGGRLMISSETQNARINIADRDFFHHHRADGGSEIVIGTPILGRIVNRWVVPVSRRFLRPDGGFGGVVTALIDISFFQNFYDELDLGEQGAILMMSNDYRLLARRPFVESNVGRDMSASNVVKALAMAPSGTLEMKAISDGVVRLNSYRRVKDYPLIISAARGHDDVLAKWRGLALHNLIVTAILLAAIAGTALVIWRMTDRLAAANIRLATAIHAMPQGFCMFDGQRRLVMANDQFRKLYRFPDDLLAPGARYETLLANLSSRIAGPSGAGAEDYAERMARDGSETVTTLDGRIISIGRQPMPGGGWVATHNDITEMKRNELSLAAKAAEVQRANERFEGMLDNMQRGVCLFDRDQKIVVANAPFAQIYGLDPDEIRPGTTLAEVMAARQRHGTQPLVMPEDDLVVGIDRSDETQDLPDGRTIARSRKFLSDGGWLSTHEDITERRNNERRITFLAEHDALTGLPNRASFMMRLGEMVRATGASQRIAVFLLDLDRFKAVNDTLGHAAGDQLLAQVARRLRHQLRDTDHVARLGGDEFAIIQTIDADHPGHEPAISLALRIIATLTEPFDLDGQPASIGTSIGIVFSPEHGEDSADLLRKADLALYAVKEADRNDFRIYDSALSKAEEQRKLLETDLAKAIDGDQLVLFYQPIIDLKTNEFQGAEALVRWQHPTRGLLGPDQFIQLAEDSGLILRLGEWVLRKGCTDAATWPSQAKVSINLSAHQFNKANLFDIVLCVLMETGLPPSRLELELTETALLQDHYGSLETLRQLRNIGVTVVLDDFGIGHSSARYLTMFPFEKIKIDKSFVQGMGKQRECDAVVASILSLAKGLDIAITAEGVETPEQLRVLTDAGVDFAQGYLIGRPVPLADLFAAAAADTIRVA